MCACSLEGYDATDSKHAKNMKEVQLELMQFHMHLLTSNNGLAKLTLQH